MKSCCDPSEQNHNRRRRRLIIAKAHVRTRFYLFSSSIALSYFHVCLSVRFMQDWCLILKLLFCLSLYAGLVLNFENIFKFLNFIAALTFHLIFNYFFNFNFFLDVQDFRFSFVCLSFLISDIILRSNLITCVLFFI